MVKKVILENGLTIIADKKDIHTANINVIVNAGSLNETDEQAGLSHFLEHMAFKGTKSKTAQQLVDDIELLGGETGAYTTRDHTSYYISLPDTDCEEGVQFLADVLKNSIFPKDELEKEREVIIQEYKECNSDPNHLAWYGIEKALFDKQESARQVLGTLENIKKFTREDLVNYFGTYYTAENMYVAISSSWPEDLMINWVGEYFKDIKPGKKNTFPINTPILDNHLVEQKEGITQDYIFMALPWIDYKDKDFYTSIVFTKILDGGMSCRLFQELREKSGLCYSCNVFDDLYMSANIFGVYTVVEQENKDIAINKIKQVINSMKTDITEKDLIKAKNMTKYNTACFVEDVKNMAKKQVHNLRYRDELYDIEKAVKEINAVTLKDVINFANRIIDDTKWTTFTLEPKND